MTHFKIAKNTRSREIKAEIKSQDKKREKR